MDIQELLRELMSDDTSEFFIAFAAVIVKIAFITILLMIGKWFIHSSFDRHLSNWLNRSTRMGSNRAETIADIFRNGLIYILYFIYLYWLLSLLGVPIGTLIAGAGIAGIAIGFGAQELIQDIINGFFIIFEGQYEIGDLITLPEEDITGTIISVGIRTTKMRTASGEIFFIPNSSVNIVNNQSRRSRSINLDLPVQDNTPIELLESVVSETTTMIQEKYSEVLVSDPDIIGFVRGVDQTFNYRITFTLKNGEQYKHESLFYREFLLAFEHNHIEIPNSVYDPAE
ncbi:mechanosensitive ion channel family protein [Aerococcaceae bacterium DSM 111020]|nr:mechanosensitive ion channel family protein [Aerococcaceae bacterium DSM 111020]